MYIYFILLFSGFLFSVLLCFVFFLDSLSSIRLSFEFCEKLTSCKAWPKPDRLMSKHKLLRPIRRHIPEYYSCREQFTCSYLVLTTDTKGHRLKGLGMSRLHRSTNQGRFAASLSQAFPPGSHARNESIHWSSHILPHLSEDAWARYALTKRPGFTSLGMLVPLYRMYPRAVTLRPH